MADKTNAELLKEFVGSYSPVFDVNPYEAKEAVEIYPTPIVETMSYVDYARVEAAPLNLAFAQLKAKVLANDSTADIVTEAITAFTKIGRAHV